MEGEDLHRRHVLGKRNIILKKTALTLTGEAQGPESGPANQRVPGPFPVRAHAGVVGQAPRRGRVRGNHTLMFLSLPSSSLKTNKQTNLIFKDIYYNNYW